VVTEVAPQSRASRGGLLIGDVITELDGGMSDDGLPFYVMEFIDGEPIDQYCRACHSDRVRSGGLALTELNLDAVDQPGSPDIVSRNGPGRGRAALRSHVRAIVDEIETLGIRTRAALLSAKANEADRAAIAQAMARLIDPRQMGSLFKALAIARPDLQELAGFP